MFFLTSGYKVHNKYEWAVVRYERMRMIFAAQVVAQVAENIIFRNQEEEEVVANK